MLFPITPRLSLRLPCLIFLALLNPAAARAGTTAAVISSPLRYPDDRPTAHYRLPAVDAGVVLHHGDGPQQCDVLGARDVWVWEHQGTYYMHYDGAGPTGWLACLAISKDLLHWTKRGAVLELGAPDSPDSASASYGVPYLDGKDWHLFYMGTPHTSGPPELVPAFPYLTLKARGSSPTGPWTKQRDVIPFRPQPDTYYSSTASPGHVIPQKDGFLMVFSAATDHPTVRTLGIARTKDLNGPWTIDPAPMLPPAEQVENSSLYHDQDHGRWWVFTNHVGLRDGMEYTDAIWAYWTEDLNKWDPAHKAIVLDPSICTWSRHIVGLPSVVQVGQRLALFYDGNAEDPMPRGPKSHMHRDVGLAWLELPLVPPPN
ncbi:MAG: hypothetical protein ABIZ04_14070 [Opitutus sp.]